VQQTHFNLSEIAERWGICVAAVYRYHLPHLTVARREGHAYIISEAVLAAYEKRLARRMRAKADARIRRLTAASL
jgi:hypothetical protein